MRLRKRSDFGVASTNSSVSMYSIARSRVIRARVFAYDYSLVDVFLRPNEKPAALLNTVECVSCADPGFHRHHYTTPASSDFAFEGRVFAKKVTHQSLSASQVDQIGLESNQAARWDD